MSVVLINLDDTFDTWRKKNNSLSLNFGDFSQLLSNELSLVRAVNTNYIKIGNLDGLTTDANSNLVDAINEIDFNTDINTINIGDLNSLQTSDKSSIINAINELKTDIGDKSLLATGYKSDLVGAINEVDTNTDSITDYVYNTVIPITDVLRQDVDTNANNIGSMSINNGTNTLTNAVNENTSLIGQNTSKIGDMVLDTPSSNLTDAINDAWNKSLEIGDLSSLTTDSKINLVEAINEIDANTDSSNASIGDLSLLDTAYKINLVGAINEVNSNAIAMALILG